MRLKVEKPHRPDASHASPRARREPENPQDAMHDGRQQAAVQRRAQDLASHGERANALRDRQAVADARPDGLPAQLKSGIEALSGMSMDHVKVHYNSPAPARAQALAYAQGHDIHLAAGQAHHLPHEAWHVVQQAQGRVRPTRQLKAGIPVNDDEGLEREADRMGNLALAGGQGTAAPRTGVAAAHGAIQRKADEYGDAEHATKKAGKQAEGHPEAPLDASLKFQRFRKLNRLAGALYQNRAVPHIDPVVTGLKTFLVTVDTDLGLTEATMPADDGIHRDSVSALREAVKPETDLTPRDYEAYSLLGPLDFWLANQHSSDDVQLELRKLRLRMAERPGVSIVAHRGHGPTNRTRGGLIRQTDLRRTGNPAENSKSAFDAAYAQTTRTGTAPSLDGIECDVFLSQDNVPILSHEGNIKEQLSDAQKVVHGALVGDNTHIEDLTAAQLTGIQRTASVDSAFLTLGGFLDATLGVAQSYFTASGKPLRVEIEMKGHQADEKITAATNLITGANAKLRKKAEKERLEAEYSGKLEGAVAKAISQFKKAHPEPWWEIILFNNSADAAKRFDALRNKKPHLGQIYTGLGSNNTVDGADARVDELRMAASGENLALMKGNKNFIVTYVPGAERAAETPNAPLGDLDFAPTQKREYVDRVNNEMRDTTGAQSTIIYRILAETAGAKNVHLLTDMPRNAGYYKGMQALAADLNGKAPNAMHTAWNALREDQKTAVRTLVLVSPETYPEAYRRIFHHQRRRGTRGL